MSTQPGGVFQALTADTGTAATYPGPGVTRAADRIVLNALLK
jgi:hypothetical protein